MSAFTRLVALYESERERAVALEAELNSCKLELESCKVQNTELTGRIDSMLLSGAIASKSDKAAARERVDKLVREIDRCIKLLEK